MRTETERRARAARENEHAASSPAPTEHVRDQIFAACGYSLALAALATWLLGPYLGARGLPTVLTLAALLAPLNLVGIRSLARVRRSWSHQARTRDETRT